MLHFYSGNSKTVVKDHGEVIERDQEQIFLEVLRRNPGNPDPRPAVSITVRRYISAEEATSLGCYSCYPPKPLRPSL